MVSTPALVTKVVRSKDGTEIFAEAIGDPSKPHLVFVHGFACNSRMGWDALFALPALQRDIYAVRYDMRGHGLSGKPEADESYEGIHYAEDFDAVSKAFNLHKPIHVGWSFGATVTGELLDAKVPIAGAIWIAPLPYVADDVISAVVSTCVREMLPAFLSTEDPGSALAARVAFCELFVAPHLLPSVPFADRAAWLTAGTQFPPVCAVRTLSRSQDPAPLAKAGKLGFPVLLIHGKEDVVNSPTAVVECMQALFDDLDIALLDGVGHAPVYEAAESTYRHIINFVDKISRKALL